MREKDDAKRVEEVSDDNASPINEAKENNLDAQELREENTHLSDILKVENGEDRTEGNIPEGINLLEALMIAQKEAAKNLEGWKRAQADYENLEKRNKRRQKDAQQSAIITLFKEVLPIFDDLERAIAAIPKEHGQTAWFDGLLLIQRKVSKYLSESEVKEIDPVGSEFDPNYHEAIATDETGAITSNLVTETLQKGYSYQGRVIRPALVRVAK